MNKKGFTLTELLGVIVVLAVIVTIAGTSVITIINKSKKHTAQEMVNNLKDAAITYCLDTSQKSSCSVTVENLISSGDFQDDKKACDKTKTIVVTRSNTDYTAYIFGYTSSNEYKVCNN